MPFLIFKGQSRPPIEVIIN